jgi:hypothetical protein
MKFGRKPRAFGNVPHYSALRFMRTAAAVYPASCDWSAAAPADLGMMLNGPTPNDPNAPELGDCTIAAVYHARQIWTASANPPCDTQPNSVVEELYEDACGYKPGDPSTDNGGVEQDVLKYWVTNGIPIGAQGDVGPNDKLLAFVEVDPTNTADVLTAIWECGVAYIGFNVPAYLMPSDGSPPPAVWDVDPNGDKTIIGGHAVILVGYDQKTQTYKLVSWGQTYTMTQAFFAAFVDEVYALADSEWIEKTGATPLGLSVAQLQAQMAAISEPLTTGG